MISDSKRLVALRSISGMANSPTLPDYVTSITAVCKGQSDTAGNSRGGNMARLPLLASIDLQQKLREISTPKDVTKSSLLFAQGERGKGAFLVESGSVSLLLKADDGKVLWRRTLGKGSLLGLPATVNDAEYSLTAKALSIVDLSFITRGNLIAAMNRDISLAIEIVKVLGQEVHDMRELMQKRGRTARARRRASLSNVGPGN